MSTRRLRNLVNGDAALSAQVKDSLVSLGEMGVTSVASARRQRNRSRDYSMRST